MIVLSHAQARLLLYARENSQNRAACSLDLGLSQAEAQIDADGAIFPDGQQLTWEAIAEIADTETACFLVENGAARKAQFYSEELDRFYSLYPTGRAPTMLLSGIPMHRIKTIDPHEDTLRKARCLAPITGSVLDTCTGLGYTAIEASKTAARVVTVELDPTVLEVCRCNPWSRELFQNPRIEQVIGDVSEAIEGFPDETFSRVFHDPPTFKIAGSLYSGAFYAQLFRVMKRGARLYHYVGDLDSTTGRVVAKGAVKRLQEAGFARVTRRPEAFGLTAGK